MVLKTSKLSVSGFDGSSLAHALVALSISVFVMDLKRMKRGLVDVSHFENNDQRWGGSARW